MKRILSAFILILLIKTSLYAQNNTAQTSDEKKMNISYGSYPSSKMDIYLPANRNGQTPFIIMIHGGGWVQGDKKYDNGLQSYLMAKGIASANMNYRFVDSFNIHYPQMLADIDSAVNFCVDHSKEWNTRMDNFMYFGESAGGHLALLYGYSTNKKVSAIIGESAPTDFADTVMLNYAVKNKLIDIVQKMAGSYYKPGEPIDPKFAASSPIHNIKNIPTLLVHGTADKTVIYSQAVALDKKLQEKNVTHKLITITGADHDLNFKDEPTRTMVYNEVVSWALKYGR